MRKKNQKLITPEIFRQAVAGSFTKLNPVYMMKNPVMFVVEIGFFITLLLSVFPNLFGHMAEGSNLRVYNIIVCVVLFATVLFANFAESVAEGRGKAQAASLKKTQKDTKARLLQEDGTETTVLSSELKKGDIVMVSAGEIIPGDGEVIEGIASVDESAITGESAPVVRGERRRLLLRHRRHHRGVRLAEDPHHLRCRQQLSGPHDRPGGGCLPQKDTQRDRTEYSAGLPDHHFPHRDRHPVPHRHLLGGAAARPPP